MVNAFQAALIGGLGLISPSFSIEQSFWQKETLIVIETLMAHNRLDLTKCLNKKEILTFLRDKPAQCCLLLLPLIVYFHDDLFTLQQQLDEIIHTYQLSQTTKESLYLWTEAITAALKRKLSPSSLMTQLVANHPYFSLKDALIEVQRGLETGVSVNQLQKSASFPKNRELTSIFLALFSFCATPDALALSLNRLSAMNLSPIALGLTSALGGAYGNIQGMPWTWWVSLEQNKQQSSKLHKINCLWHKWTGKLDYDRNLTPLTSIISPLTLQDRPSLRLVSHQEYVKFPRLKDTESEPSLIIEIEHE